MTVLREALGDYLAMRRALGYKLERTELLLGQYVDELEARGASTITTANAIEWVTAPAGSRAWWLVRLAAVRGFAAYLHTLDERCEVPPSDLLARPGRRRVPFLYTDAELAALLAVTDSIPSPLRAATYRTLICLLAVTGLRVGEAIGADRDDLDLAHGRLLVRCGKFGKTRRLPLHPTTVDALAAYLHRADRPRPTAPEPLLVSTAGTRLLYPNVSRTFVRLVADAGLKARSVRCRPRIHDLRHTFAVRALLDCYLTGVDVETRLPLLSAYLGHANPKDTYWYLTGSPELLALAGQRLDAALEDPS
ncbi:MAG: tyrosine-type recombinase/integrase [Actinobacteria bacterium]|nr:tyrosine-type recombinase/integrase [Actinomycetota bacterium]